MLNWVWFGLLATGMFFAAAGGNMEQTTAAAFSAASDAVLLILEICGLLCLWMGMLRIAERSGLVDVLARLISPLARRLFPSVPPQHPAFSAIVMNIAANLLGLGNAATPFGLKAMEYLQTLNPQPDTASAPMITLLAMNTSCITLLPTMVISLRLSAGSAVPTAIIGATMLASSIGFVFALLLDRAIRRREQHRGR